MALWQTKSLCRRPSLSVDTHLPLLTTALLTAVTSVTSQRLDGRISSPTSPNVAASKLPGSQPSSRARTEREPGLVPFPATCPLKGSAPASPTQKNIPPAKTLCVFCPCRSFPRGRRHLEQDGSCHVSPICQSMNVTSTFT